MSGKLKVSHERITSVADELGDQRSILDRRLTEIEGIMTTLTTDGLVTEFLSLAVIVRADSMKRNLLKALDSIEHYETFLREASEAYKDVDSELARKLGGGGGAVDLDVDVDGLTDLKTHLSKALTALNAGKNSCRGLGPAILGHEEVVDAMADFDSDWRIRRGRIIESVDSLVSGYTAIVDSLEETDSRLHSNLSKGSKK